MPSFFQGKKKKIMKLELYNANISYCDFLRKFDSKVPYISGSKSTRPFIGVLFYISDMEYYAPLTSPKPKHLTMKDQIDFILINKGEWGAINLNNMIPIRSDYLICVNMIKYCTDSKKEINYKNLLVNQKEWCNSNQAFIINHAQRLYNVITKNQATEKILLRCCNFTLLENKCVEYCK